MWNNGQIVPLGTTVHPIPPPPPSAPSETEANAEARLEEKARKWQQMNSKRYSVRENPGLLRLRKTICLVNMSEKSSGSRCEGLNVIVKVNMCSFTQAFIFCEWFDEVFDQPDPTKALKKLVNPRLGDNYSIDSVFKKLGVIVKPTEKPRLVLKFIWMEKNIGIALGHGTIPLSPYYFWPRKDAWEELKELLESKRWISQKQ